MITEGGPFADLFRRKEGKGRKIDDDTEVITGEKDFYRKKRKIGILTQLDINRKKRSYVSEFKDMDPKEFLKTQRREDYDTEWEKRGYDIIRKRNRRRTDLSFKEKSFRKINESEWGQKRFRKGKPFSLTTKDINKRGQNITTAWENYRAAVKDYRKKEIKSQPLFSQERKEARKDFYGKRGWDTKRGQASTGLSIKNKWQRKMLYGKLKGQGGRGVHTPHIPVLKQRVSFAEWRQDRQNRKEIALGGTDYSGYTPTGAIQTNCMDGICKITKKMTSNLKKARESDIRYK